LVLTSVYAIQAVARESARVPRVAVVSESSRRAAEAKGFRVELVSPGGDGKSLFAELRKKATQGKVCYPRSSQAKAPDSWPGVELLSPVLYETVARDFDQSVIDRVDVVSVTSPSAVEAIRAPSASAGCFTSPTTGRPVLSESGKPISGVSVRDQRGLRFASIGPSTSAALRRFDVEPWIEAPERNFESLARSIAGMPGDSRG
jgi:uroporphyrinogen-III synthase